MRSILTGVVGMMRLVPNCVKVLVMFGVSIWLPNKVAMADDLFVADAVSGHIYEFTPSGSQSTFATVDTGINEQMDLAFDSSGNLFMASFYGSKISKFTPSGSQSYFASSPLISDLTFDNNGNLYVASCVYGYPCIDIFTSNGNHSYFTGQMDYPIALAFDNTGNLFVARWYNGNIYKFSTSGSSSIFATGIIGPRALAFDSNDNLFVANANGIYEFTPSGTQSVFATGLNMPWDLAFDSSGNLFEADFGSGSIYEFTPSGSQSVFATGLNGPTGLAFFPVPEPSTLILLGIGTVSLLTYAWQKRRQTA